MKLPDIAANTEVLALVQRALKEDIGKGDVTTEALVPASATARASIVARTDCVVAGTTVAAAVFRKLDPTIAVHIRVKDGSSAASGATIMQIAGKAKAILSAERTALNFLQRMCGIATLSRKFVEKLKGLGVTVLDTRKTTPGMRPLEKYAVLCGGARNHRMGLYDMILIKDNHECITGGAGQRFDFQRAVARARQKNPGLPVEVEVESKEQLKQALKAAPEWIMLDNMSPSALKRCVAICAGQCRLEASGGITLENVRSVARTGVDAISVGALTHSAPAADLAMEFE